MPIIRDRDRRSGLQIQGWPELHETLFQDKIKKGWRESSTCKVITVQEGRPKFHLPDSPMLEKLVQWYVCTISQLNRKTERPFELTD